MKIAIINPGGITNFGERAIMLGTVYSLRDKYKDATIAIFGYENLKHDDPSLHQELSELGVEYFPAIMPESRIAKIFTIAGMVMMPKFTWPTASYSFMRDAEVYSKGQETLTENYGFVHFVDSVLEQLLVSRINKNITLYGQSIGPVKKHRWLAKRALSRFKDVYTRDSRSYEVTKSLGHPVAHIHQIKDLAYEAIAQHKLTTKPGSNDCYLIIPNAAICKTTSQREKYMANLQTIIDHLLKNKQKVFIGSSVTDLGWNNDYNLCDELHANNPDTELRHYKELHELLVDIKAAKCVVSSRLHPLIMATGLKRPVYALSQSQKVLGLLGDLGLDRQITDPFETVTTKDLDKLT